MLRKSILLSAITFTPLITVSCVNNKPTEFEEFIKDKTNISVNEKHIFKHFVDDKGYDFSQRFVKALNYIYENIDPFENNILARDWININQKLNGLITFLNNSSPDKNKQLNEAKVAYIIYLYKYLRSRNKSIKYNLNEYLINPKKNKLSKNNADFNYIKFNINHFVENIFPNDKSKSSVDRNFWSDIVYEHRQLSEFKYDIVKPIWQYNDFWRNHYTDDNISLAKELNYSSNKNLAYTPYSLNTNKLVYNQKRFFADQARVDYLNVGYSEVSHVLSFEMNAKYDPKNIRIYPGIHYGQTKNDFNNIIFTLAYEPELMDYQDFSSYWNMKFESKNTNNEYKTYHLNIDRFVKKVDDSINLDKKTIIWFNQLGTIMQSYPQAYMVTSLNPIYLEYFNRHIKQNHNNFMLVTMDSIEINPTNFTRWDEIEEHLSSGKLD
ncbi:hypothetical protein [Mycoplasma simbae]|uniref:hypothetical protein n=1 Tax=Mycoplasma simbae TaxID=36744 RepID=UPI000495A31A|nr:hypothetical protein [Mycoplasma simbae]